MKRQRHWTYREEKLRLKVLRRDNYECQIRLPTICRGTANSVDHIIRKEDGGPATAENLRAACMPCNNALNNRKTREAFGGESRFFRAPQKKEVGSSRVDLQACKLEYSIVSPK